MYEHLAAMGCSWGYARPKFYELSEALIAILLTPLVVAVRLLLLLSLNNRSK